VTRDQARALLDAATSRGAQKTLGQELDGDLELRRAVLEEGRARGVDLPDEAVAWPGKRLLRLARGREAAARVRRNPIARDEAFRCAACGVDVPAHGRSARDHCPACLCSLHVDVVPGDRASGCGGILDAVDVELRGTRGAVLIYRCRACGAEKRNQALLDGEPPDDWARIVALAADR